VFCFTEDFSFFTDDNMAHAHCMLDTQGYKCTYRLYNINCLSILKMFARTHHNFTLYVEFFILKY